MVEQNKGNAALQRMDSTPTYIAAAQAHFGAERFALIRETIGKDLTLQELALFLEVAMSKKLDPFARQIHAVKRKSKKRVKKGNQFVDEWVESMTIQTGIDGFRVIAQRTGQYEGQGGPFWCGEDGAWKDVWLDTKKPPRAAKVEVFRKGFRAPLVGIALWDEYAQINEYDGVQKLIGLWRTHPSVMIAKCAESVALRRAFPEDLAGLYTSEEMKTEDLADELRVRMQELDARLGGPKLAPAIKEQEAELVPTDKGVVAEVSNLESGATVKQDEAPRVSGAKKRSATAILLDFKKAVDATAASSTLDATLAAWREELDKLPLRAKQMAIGYASVHRTRLETGEEVEDQGAAQLNELAKK